MATMKSAKAPEDERIRIETEDSTSDATLARTQPVENSPAVASPLSLEPPHADLIGQYYVG